jgi:hypothetical protein
LEKEIEKARFQVDEDISDLCTDLIERILVPMPSVEKKVVAEEGKEED